MTASEALVLTVRTWTTDETTVTRAREIGTTLDGLVAEALGQTDPPAARAALRAAVIALDRLPLPLISNVPNIAWTRYYEATRRALHACAVARFGVEGQQVAPALEHDPLMPERASPFWGLFR
jgi:hypothetical protein